METHNTLRRRKPVAATTKSTTSSFSVETRPSTALEEEDHYQQPHQYPQATCFIQIAENMMYHPLRLQPTWVKYWNRIKAARAAAAAAQSTPNEDRATILLWGGNRSGKSTLLYRWKLGECIPTVTTVGMLEENFTYEYLGPAYCGQLSGRFNKLARLRTEITFAEIGRDPTSLESKCYYPNSTCITMTTAEEDEEDCSSPSKYHRQIRKYSGFRDLLKRMCCGCCLTRKAPSTDYVLSMWARAVQAAEAVVYVVDCSHRAAMAEMYEDLMLILHNDSLKARNIRVLVLANKQDVWGCITPKELEELLDLPKHNGRCVVMGCSALTGQNVNAAMKWLHEGIMRNKGYNDASGCELAIDISLV